MCKAAPGNMEGALMSMEDKYRFLFPFEKVKPGSRIVLYGAGKMGQEYIDQIERTGYCQIVAVVDKNYREYQGYAYKVSAPAELGDYDPDYIVVALRNKVYLNEILENLRQNSISDQKVIFIGEREQASSGNKVAGAAHRTDVSDMYEKTSTRIAVYTMGGIGDCIIQKKVITTLLTMIPDSKIDIYCSANKSFLDMLYFDAAYIGHVIANLGTRYEREAKSYDLAFQICGTEYMEVDYIDDAQLELSVAKKMHALQKKTDKEYYLRLGNPAAIGFLQKIRCGHNCYTGLSYGDIFAIKDCQVDIKLPASSEETFEKAGLRRYITVNCGNGACRNESLVAKSWPVEYFEQLLKKIKGKYPQLDIVQVGGPDTRRLQRADRFFMGESFPMVGQILKHSLLHIDIEGGLVHFATQLGTKCVVLFGPTYQEFFGYPQNINIQAGNCHGCYGLYPDVNQCARNMAQPECMYSITPEIVMQAVQSYLEGKDIVTAEQETEEKEKDNE